MKILALFFSLLAPSLALAQGTAIRSMNGDGTNTTIKGLTLKNITASRPAILNANGTITNATGTPDGTKFLRDDGSLQSIAAGITNVSQTAVGSGSYLTYTLTDNGFLSGWGGNQPTFIFRDGGATKFEYAGIGWDDISNAGKAGQLNLRGLAGIPYGNLGGIHFNDMHLGGDNRGFVFRVKSVSGTNVDQGSYVWIGVRYDADTPAPDYLVDGGSTYASPVVLSQYGDVYLGHLGIVSDDPATIPAWFKRWGKVNIYGTPGGDVPSLVVTNQGGTNHMVAFFGPSKDTNTTVVTQYGWVGVGTSSPGHPLHVVGPMQLNSNLVFTGGAANNWIGPNVNSAYNPADNGSRGGISAVESFYIQIDANASGTAARFQVRNNSTAAALNGGGLLFDVDETGNIFASGAGHFSTANTSANMAWPEATIVLTNRSSSGQIEVVAVINDVHKGGFRVDQNAGFNWHGVSHVFWNATNAASHALTIAGQRVGIGVSAGVTAKEVLEVVGNVRITNGALRVFSGNTPTATNNQAQVYSKTNLITVAAGVNALDGSGAEYVLTAAVTNTYSGSATLNFASQSLGGVEDLPITVTGAVDGDVVSIGVPSGATTGIAGSFTGFASNGVVFVRFISTAATQDPASGTFKALVHKTR